MKSHYRILTFGAVFFVGCVIAQDTAVQTLSGTGKKNTRPFTVQNGWEIQWDARGDIFGLCLFRADGEIESLPAFQTKPGKGASYQAKGGTYYLEVNAAGDWTIKIVQVRSQSSLPVAPAIPAPAMTPSAVTSPLDENNTDTILAGLPNAAVQSYWRASSIPYSTETEVTLRKWFRAWEKYMRDPNKALIELDFAEFLIQEHDDLLRWRLNIKTAQQIIVAVKARRQTDARVLDKLAEIQEAASKAEDSVGKQKPGR